MAVFDLYSKRQKQLRGEVPDVYNYNTIPHPLRVQIVHILNDAIGIDEKRSSEKPAKAAYDFINRTLCREYGVFKLNDTRYDQSSTEAVQSFLLQTGYVDKVLDVIELAFKFINLVINEQFEYHTNCTSATVPADKAIEELNDRFKEHGVGYQFEVNEIIRVDSTYMHAEVVKPTLALLSNSKFLGANEEYLKAHEHYRHGRNKECLAECLKAFESTMKIICQEKGWPVAANATSSKLVQACLDNGLVPAFTQGQFTSLRSLLDSGIPTIRNRTSGHGQGAVPQEVDDEMTRYGLNLTGTNIIFLIEQSGIV
jgi:hypothetical protein